MSFYPRLARRNLFHQFGNPLDCFASSESDVSPMIDRSSRSRTPVPRTSPVPFDVGLTDVERTTVSPTPHPRAGEMRFVFVSHLSLQLLVL
jgi:hypothetical protein